MIEVPTLFEKATQAHRSGRIDEAIRLYRDVIRLDKSNAQARYLAGCILMDRAMNTEAERLFREAIAINGGVPAFYGAYGCLLMRMDREEESLACLKTGVSTPGARRDVHHAYVNALNHFHKTDDLLPALDAMRDAFGYDEFLMKNYIEVLSLKRDMVRLGAEVEVGRKLGVLNESLANQVLCKAASLDNRPEEAILKARDWLRKSGGTNDAVRLYADALSSAGYIEESLPYYFRLYEETPEDGELARKLGSVFFKKERYAEAARFFAVAMKNLEDHKSVEAPYSYSIYKSATDPKNASEIGKAYYYSLRCYEDNPADASLAMNLSSVLLKMLRIKDGLNYYKRAADLNPTSHANVSSRLFHLNYSDAITREEMFKAHKSWNAMTREKLGPPKTDFDNDRNPERRLRIGFISADFMYHPVSYFFISAFRALLKDFDIYLYSNLALQAEDDISRQYQREASGFRNVHDLSPEAVQKQAIDDRIDVMIDLSGHTTGNMLTPLAMRLAPVQVEWLGYPNTTGLDTMDYRISDEVTEPSGDADRFSTEKILRLPGGFHLYKPPYAIPPENPLPALSTHIITFGSFNNMKKVSVSAVELWCGLMRAVPNSRIALKDRNLESPSTMSRIKTLFAAHGVDPRRITTKGMIKNNFEHMNAYSQVDIALDSFPYNGTTTTCEALIMGCPVVTLQGDSHVARVSSSLLTHVGHPEWIARSPGEFVRIAASLAADTAALSRIRAGLRKEVNASPLCDAERMRRELGGAIRSAWRNWCGQVKK